jgi:1,4-alpha-glucan branching enzyme
VPGENNTEISFRLDAPLAKEVLLVGEFTEWEKTPVRMIKGGGGVWHTKLRLASGRHHYRFIVDGQWQDDPNSQTHVPNPFGTFNSVVQVG